jgi:hypothetical protein
MIFIAHLSVDRRDGTGFLEFYAQRSARFRLTWENKAFAAEQRGWVEI